MMNNSWLYTLQFSLWSTKAVESLIAFKIKLYSNELFTAVNNSSDISGSALC